MIIGICGGSGSGKTTIAKKLVEKIGKDKVILVEQDSYYINLADIPLDERRRVNFDHPDSIDSESLARLLDDLKRGKTGEMPVYDFASHTTKEATAKIEPKQIVIVEGILIFTFPKVLEQLDLKVFIDTPDEVRFKRRLKRDVEERGRTVEQTTRQFEKTILPMHKEFVEPSKPLADIVVSNEDKTEEVINSLCDLINKKVSEESIKAAT